jgi:hypothetical protein
MAGLTPSCAIAGSPLVVVTNLSSGWRATGGGDAGAGDWAMLNMTDSRTGQPRLASMPEWAAPC